MQSISSSVAQEQSTFVVNLAFTDEDDAAVTPSAIVYSLVDRSGNVINSLEDVSVSPASSVDIVLSGDDLQITTAEQTAGYTKVARYLIVEAVYDSDAGSNLTLKEEISFMVENLKKVS